MAATPSNKKQVMDVSKPGKVAPSATTRPLIVGHGGMIKDPMVSDEGEAVAAPSPEAMNGQDGVTQPAKPRGPKILQPLNLDDGNASDKAATEESAATAAEMPSASDAKALEAPAADTEETPASPADTASSDEAPKEETPADSANASAADETKDEKADPDSENAAVVDAVVDQANIGKKQKVEDKEAEARKQMVAKLIEEKKYFVPIKQKATTRSGRLLLGVLLAVVLLLAGGYAAVDAGIVKPGFDVPMHFIGKKEAATATDTPATVPVANTAPVAQPATPATVEYANKELGISFSYPSAWGDVAVKKESGSIGAAVSLTFSKQPMLKASMSTVGYMPASATVSGGACFVSVDMTADLTFESIKDVMTKQIQAASSTTTVRTLLKSTETVFAYERFEAGEATATSCVGLSVAGYKKFTGQQYTGLHVVWKDPAQKSVPSSDIAKYKSSPNDFLSEQNRKDILAVIDSTKTQ